MRKDKNLRSIWGRSEDEEQPKENEEQAPSILDLLSSESGTATLENIAAARPERDRSWERRHPTASYRGVPQMLNESVLEIAGQLGVTRDDVMRAFLEYAFQIYKTGNLPLTPRPGPRRMTLFPPEGGSGWKINRKNPNPPQPQGKKRKSTAKSEKRWQRVTSFRIPQELKKGIRQVAKRNGDVSPGEVVTFFLNRALDDYRAGILVLNPIATASTLYPAEDQK